MIPYQKFNNLFLPGSYSKQSTVTKMSVPTTYRAVDIVSISRNLKR